MSMRAMAEIGLWNLEGKIWSLMEGIGMVVYKDKDYWCKMFWNSSLSDSSDEFSSSNIVSSVGSSCSEK